jgi:hypothetical protein
MPKKFDDAKKKEWLELYDEGKSEKWIAGQAGCDIRTVKKAINDARLKRDVVIARIELVKDALRKHQDGLLGELDQIMASLVIPQRDFAVLSWPREIDYIFNEYDKQMKLKNGEDSTMRRLLKEHLKNDKLWRVLAQWEKASANHLAARVAFQRREVTLLQEKTGYKLTDGGGTPPFVYTHTTGPLFFKAAIDIAFSTPEEKARESAIRNMETAISVNTSNGDVSFENHSILAVAPGSEERIKENLLDAFRILADSSEVKAVVETCQVLEQITPKTRQVVEGIRLLGLVPGQCEICRRLGM